MNGPVSDELLTYADATDAIPRQLPNERLLFWPVKSRFRPKPEVR